MLCRAVTPLLSLKQSCVAGEVSLELQGTTLVITGRQAPSGV